MNVKSLSIFVVSLFLIVIGFASEGQAQNTLTLTTYYPAPFGAYDRVRLVPRSALSGACDIGSMYVDDTDNTMRYCEAGTWTSAFNLGLWNEITNGIAPKDDTDTDFLGLGVVTAQTKLHISADSNTNPNYGGEMSGGRLSGSIILEDGNPSISLIGRNDAGGSGANIKLAYIGPGSPGAFEDQWVIWRNDLLDSGALRFSYQLGANDYQTGVGDRLTILPSGLFSVSGTIIGGAGGNFAGDITADDGVLNTITASNALTSDTATTLSGQFEFRGTQAYFINNAIDRKGLQIDTSSLLNRVTLVGQDQTTGTQGLLLFGMAGGSSSNMGLDISPFGFVAVKGMSTETYELEVTGDISATGFIYSSDESLKKDIAPIPSALDSIAKLEGVHFTWKESDESDVGVIAQNVEEVFPELVTVNKKTGMKSVKYGNLIAPLIEAVKEEKVIVEKQNERIEAQAKEIKDLKSELEKLKSMIKGLVK